MSSRKSPKHTTPRNRKRQSDARALAKAEGITYQQALARLDAQWWTCVLEVTFRYHPENGPYPAGYDPRAATALNDRIRQQITTRTETASALGALGAILSLAQDYLGQRAEIRAADLDRSYISDDTYEPDVLLSFAARNEQDAEQKARALADELDGLYDDAVQVDVDDRYAPRPVRRLNTELSYLYRDANNYKTAAQAIFEGEPTPELMDLIRSNLDDGEYFIPSQVGLHDLQGDLQQYDPPEREAEYETDPDSDPDHPWHELDARIDHGMRLTSAQPGDESIPSGRQETGETFEQFARQFAATTWDGTILVR